jgi:hypothetical protein
MEVVKKSEFEMIIVDTTVQVKAIAHPTDSRLLEITRHKMASAAKQIESTPSRRISRLLAGAAAVRSSALVVAHHR